MIRTCDIIMEWLKENGYSIELIAPLTAIPHFDFVRVHKYILKRSNADIAPTSDTYLGSGSALISIDNKSHSVVIDSYGSLNNSTDIGWLTSPWFFNDFKKELDNSGVEHYDFK